MALDKLINDLGSNGWETEIIISSCWRWPGCKDWFNEQFKYFGSEVAGGKVIGETIRMTGVDRSRDLEIIDFLEKYGHDNYDSFIAIDDDSHDMKRIKNNFYHTNGRIGLHKLDSYFICKMVDNLEIYNDICNMVKDCKSYEISTLQNEYRIIDQIFLHVDSLHGYNKACVLLQWIVEKTGRKNKDITATVWYNGQFKKFYI